MLHGAALRREAQKLENRSLKAESSGSIPDGATNQNTNPNADEDTNERRSVSVTRIIAESAGEEEGELGARCGHPWLLR
jgi:hypothetical protein